MLMNANLPCHELKFTSLASAGKVTSWLHRVIDNDAGEVRELRRAGAATVTMAPVAVHRSIR
jgi:hypothetical protein